MASTVKKVTKSVLPFYGVAVIWAGYTALFGLRRPSDFLLVSGVSLLSFLLLDKMTMQEEVTEVPDTPDTPPTPVSTGNAELDKMMADGEKAIREMRRLNDNIEDEKLSTDIARLEKSAAAIFAQVKAQPEKLPQIRRFMDYYLPTTLKLLNAYDRMGAAGISGENIDATKARVNQMMTTIVMAFEKQYDALFGTDALDISTEISVLETMMAREGFTGEQMKAETTTNPDGTDIRLEL